MPCASNKPRPDFSRRSALVRSYLPTADEVRDCIIYNAIISLHALKGIPNVENSSESSMIAPLLVKPFALKLSGIALCPGTHVIQASYRFDILLRHLQQSYTVLEFIVLESSVFMAAWLLESTVELL